MENIVRLAEYRKRRARPPRGPVQRATHADDAAQYFCTRCDGGEFRLSSLGVVHCAHCGALMRNLLITPTPSTVPEAG